MQDDLHLMRIMEKDSVDTAAIYILEFLKEGRSVDTRKLPACKTSTQITEHNFELIQNLIDKAQYLHCTFPVKKHYARLLQTWGAPYSSYICCTQKL